jgi:peptide/nickel transport system substrate-binding protein/microcin C transport system substrate-binding protein
VPTDTFFNALGAEPDSINPITARDAYSAEINSFIFDGLLTTDPDTNDWKPGLADKWESSKDGLTYTFHLRDGLQFHDGQPVTADDVKFSFDYIRDDRYKAAEKRPYYDNFIGCTKVDDHTVKFVAKKKIFNNLMVLASGGFMAILPKHFYEDPNKRFDTIIGSGPYRLLSYDRGKNMVLIRNPNWWGFSTPEYKSWYPIPKLYYRFVTEENLRLEMTKKGDLDFIELTPEAFSVKTVGAPWGETVIKEKVENLTPVNEGFVGWNFKNPLFQSKEVRQALAYLMNRELMNQKFRYGMSLLASGPWYRQNPYADPDTQPIPFDPKKAAYLLQKAGFNDVDKDGVLEKEIGGKKIDFRFTLLLANRDSEKYLTIYQEDLKKAGIVMDIKVVEWNTFMKSLDEKKFDAVAMAWGGGAIDYDPKQIWHSESMRDGGSNFISYSNKEVDHLIDTARAEIDNEKRKVLLRKVFHAIAEDAPYAFMFNDRYHLYAHNKRIKMDQPTRKYSLGSETWHIEP